MPELLATVADVNAHLDNQIVQADDTNTDTIQISVRRQINAYLSQIFDRVTLASWNTPDETPETIREIAAMLIASQLYMEEISRSSSDIDDTSYAQRLYDKAMAMLNLIISGGIVLDIQTPPQESLTLLDFYPVDDTNRAFSLGMNVS